MIMHDLHHLLDANRAFALNGRGTTNHCPMALHALHEMGANPRQLQQFFAHWQANYALPGGEQQQGDEEELQFVRLRQQLATRLADEGWLPTFASLLEQGLSPAGGAFHPLIRFACALENGHQGEQAAALAAWQCNPLRVPAGQRAPVQDIDALLSALARQWEGARWQGEWITERLRQVTDAPTWATGLPSGVSSSDLLVQLADAALALYWQTGNFTVLHMVTGSRAAAIVASHLPEPWQARWQTLMWQAVAAAYVTVGAPSLQTLVWPDTGKLSWQNVLARAVASLDDHVIKLVHCCWREGLARPLLANRYLAVAARAAGLLAPHTGPDAI
ncbi:questin oxidase family protein [Aeromonas hydrophila]|uniref:questin oxidase family protein n=1 Tax=Aeromonas hydrophila TaxID=644 RepID=UPI00209EE087|nr:questin oxidase family protein [Aeromonas hydrophila]MCP1265256.1 questin oxidase family protein [Aeromonas hydrophila]MCP1293445.1 questin oxidase family protein [Aeromonas hydrophila]